MNKEELKNALSNYRMGFMTGLEFIMFYLEFLSVNTEGSSDEATDVIYEADELLRPLLRKIEKRI